MPHGMRIMARTTLKHLIDAGLLSTGEELRCEPLKGEVYTAQLQADGSILFDGTIFGSPSNWAKHVAGNARNGWRDVHARGQPLGHYRSKLGEQTSGPVSRPGRHVAEDGPIQVLQDPAAGPEPKAPQEERERDIAQLLLERIKKLQPDQFENLVGEFLKEKGLHDVRITQRSHDGGFDGDGTLPFVGLKVAFQAKRYQSQSIGVDMVAAFKGRIGDFDSGVFVATSTFTAGAREVAEQAPTKVVLVDGNELVHQMIEMGLGVKTIPVVQQEFDEGFFKSLGASGS